MYVGMMRKLRLTKNKFVYRYSKYRNMWQRHCATSIVLHMSAETKSCLLVNFYMRKYTSSSFLLVHCGGSHHDVCSRRAVCISRDHLPFSPTLVCSPLFANLSPLMFCMRPAHRCLLPTTFILGVSSLRNLFSSS